MKKLAIMAGVLAALALPAAAQETFKMHHFVPPKAPPSSRFMMPWSDKVRKESGGKIKIDIFPAMQLGGTPPQLVDQVRDGVVDFTFTLPGYTADRFPRSEVFETPFLHTNALASAQAMQDYYDKYLVDEYKDYQVILLYTHDGAVVPWEIVPGLKLQEIVKFHSETDPKFPAFYTSVFIYAMNTAKYNSLPADHKKVLDANSGVSLATFIGKVFIDGDVPGRKSAEVHNNTIITTKAKTFLTVHLAF